MAQGILPRVGGVGGAIARTLLPLVVLLAGPAWAAPEDGFELGAGVDRTHDSNVFRLAGTTNPLTVLGVDRRGDDLTTVQVSGALTMRPGRQQLTARFRAADVRYAAFSALDHRAGRVGGEWRWQLGNRVHGVAETSRTRQLSGFEDFRPGALTRNLETVDATRLDADYGFHSSGHLEAGLFRRNSENSSAARRTSDHRGHGGHFGLRYEAASGTTLALRTRLTDGNYPNRVRTATLDTDYLERVMDLAAVWPVSGKSRLNARVGHVERRYDMVTADDFSGRTWSMGWDWAATGSTSLSLQWGSQVSAQDDFASTHARLNTLQMQPRWRLSESVQLEANFYRARRDFQGDPAALAPGVAQRSDRLAATGVSLSYQPRRWVNVVASARQERRESNVVGGDYRARVLSLNLNLAL